MNYYSTRKRVILIIMLVALIVTLVIEFKNGGEEVNQQEINASLQTVRQDCKLWCLDPSLTIQYEGKYMGYGGKENLAMSIRRKNDQFLEASYYVIPESQNFIKIIFNWRLMAIDDGSAAKAKEYADLKYTIIKDSKGQIGTSQIMNVSTKADEIAAYRGKLMTLFGAPLHETNQYDDAFMYLFEARDQANHKWLFTAYQGASGFAIGSNLKQKDSKAAAVAFLEDLNTIPPTDFERSITNRDDKTNFTYGCKDKKCYLK